MYGKSLMALVNYKEIMVKTFHKTFRTDIFLNGRRTTLFKAIPGC